MNPILAEPCLYLDNIFHLLLVSEKVVRIIGLSPIFNDKTFKLQGFIPNPSQSSAEDVLLMPWPFSNFA